MLLVDKGDVWKYTASVIAVVSAIFIAVRRLLRPWLSKTVIWLLEQEHNQFMVSVSRMFLNRENTPGVRSMLEKVHRDRFTDFVRRIDDNNKRIEDIRITQDRLERTISLAHQSLGTLSVVVDGHDELMKTISEAVTKNNALASSQIDVTQRLNQTLDNLSKDIKEHTSEIGELRGLVQSLRGS